MTDVGNYDVSGYSFFETGFKSVGARTGNDLIVAGCNDEGWCRNAWSVTPRFVLILEEDTHRKKWVFAGSDIFESIVGCYEDEAGDWTLASHLDSDAAPEAAAEVEVEIEAAPAGEDAAESAAPVEAEAAAEQFGTMVDAGSPPDSPQGAGPEQALSAVDEVADAK